MNRQVSALAWPAWVVFGLVAWYSVLSTGMVSPAALAWPHEVLAAMPKLLEPSENLSDTVSTVFFSLLAFVISVPVGVILGFSIHLSGPFRGPTGFSLDFVRSIPATALVPVFLIVVGINNWTKVTAGAFSAALVVGLSTLRGLHSGNSTRRLTAELFGVRGIKRVLYLDLPEAAPQIFLGLRTGISLALILVVVAEMMIGGNHGLGKVIADMRYTDDKPRLYAALIATGVVGYVYNFAVDVIESKVLHWRGY